MPRLPKRKRQAGAVGSKPGRSLDDMLNGRSNMNVEAMNSLSPQTKGPRPRFPNHEKLLARNPTLPRGGRQVQRIQRKRH